MPTIPDEVLAIAHVAGCNIFIESGTARGASFSKAIRSGIFERCYSVEIQPEFHRELMPRFPDTPSRKIFLGKSYEVFVREIFPLCSANDRLFFWLDAHFSSEGTGGKDLPCPLLDELAAIEQHCPTRSIVIAIDDADDFGRRDAEIEGHNWPTRSEIEAAVRRISPNLICQDYSGTRGTRKLERGLLVFSYRRLHPALELHLLRKKLRTLVYQSLSRVKSSVR